MLLSEAIRLGAMLGPQIKGLAIGDDLVSSCALGSAALATGYKASGQRGDRAAVDHLARIFPRYDHYCAVGKEPLGKAIAERNDFHGMTREQIADWVAASGMDCESAVAAPAQDLAAKLISEHMVAK